ncbi:MAG TPA: acyltransferase, partial [Acidimicrobiales bacterium]|nr:acyltransferase [Acidimicrobiales bacterium]
MEPGRSAGGVVVHHPASSTRPGVDGLRAIAVTAVLLYHADVSWLPAGLLGVDVFFVISGYLISSLLLEERARRGRIDLPRFWMRRARRLLPALFAMLLVVALAGPLLARDAAPGLRGDVPAALVYLSNWWQAFHHQSYFAAMGRPPLLQHLWSLAVEEQFYLVFPVLLVIGVRLVGGRRARLAVPALVVGGLSAAAMAVLWHSGADPSRVYYGTDTHAVGLCVGVALGFAAPLHRRPAAVVPAARRILDGAGALGLVVLLALMHVLNQFSAGLYRGGFAVASVATAFVVVGAAQPGTRLSQLMGLPPLVWAGKRSYAIYLWHWPVFMLTRPGLDVALGGWRLLALRMGLVA